MFGMLQVRTLFGTCEIPMFEMLQVRENEIPRRK